MAGLFLGTICAFSFDFTPIGWAACEGQTFSAKQYPALFSYIGYNYGGSGDSFKLPDLRDRAALCIGTQGTSVYRIGQSGGVDAVTLAQQNLPSHTHTVTVSVPCNAVAGNSFDPNNNFPSATSLSPGAKIYVPGAQAGVFMQNPQVTLANAGGSQPVNIQRPYLAMRYCMKVDPNSPT